MVPCSLCDTTTYPIVSSRVEKGERIYVCHGCVTAAAVEAAHPTASVGRKKA